MGKRSVKENKNIYQQYREAADLTRDKASEGMLFVSADRIEKIENDRSAPHPDEILAMAECYGRPELINHYCTSECPIGMKHVPVVEEKDLPSIALEIIDAINVLEGEKNRFISIAKDGRLTQDEEKDFERISSKLKEISSNVSSLQLWLQKNGVEE